MSGVKRGQGLKATYCDVCVCGTYVHVVKNLQSIALAFEHCVRTKFAYTTPGWKGSLDFSFNVIMM